MLPCRQVAIGNRTALSLCDRAMLVEKLQYLLMVQFKAYRLGRQCLLDPLQFVQDTFRELLYPVREIDPVAQTIDVAALNWRVSLLGDI